MRVRPFPALRPAPELAARVAAPPYDVVTRAEAAALAAANPLSFLHVSRAEIDLPGQIDPYDPRVYARARDNLDRLVERGALLREPRPSLYLYRAVRQGRAQTGVVGCAHVDDYESGVIRKHETTRPDKEDDRTRHILALGAHPEPVLLAHRALGELRQLAAQHAQAPPLYDVSTPAGVRHTLWRVAEPGRYTELFTQVPVAYVADGHHRSASAWRAARERRPGRGTAGRELESDWFPAVLFPAEELQILPYNRLIADLGGQSPGELLARLAAVGRLTPTEDPVPRRPGSFCLYLAGRWYRLELDDASIDRRDPVRSLEITLLQERVLAPVLGIADQRTDGRIDFVGGIHGAGELARRVDSGAAALAVSLRPTTMAELMAVADAGQIMPPKSTWFEPKLLSGLFIHVLDSRHA